MRRAVVVGIAGGAAISVWSVATMLSQVSYGVWDVGRSVIFAAFLAVLTGLAASVARSRRSLAPAIGAVTVAALVAAMCTLATYAAFTRFFAHWIVQLPEYARDYAYHGYTSPATYLADNYSALLGLQIFSWAIGAAGLGVVACTTGWCLSRFTLPRAT